jgi:GT2 family glycosyltransferase
MSAISIILVAYKSESDICGCIDSIFNNLDVEKEDLEVIVVDNSQDESAGRTQALIVARYGEAVRYFSMKENLGYGRGNNFGIKVCRAELVCVMNPDVRLRSPLFSFARQRFSQDQNLAMLGFRQIGGRNLSFYFYPEFFLPLIGSVFLKVCNRVGAFFPRFFFPSGALVFIHKRKFDEIGGYDREIFLYCEDSDLSKRFRDAGYGLNYSSTLQYDHLVDVLQRRRRTDASLAIEYESMAHYFKKHGFSKRWYYVKRFIDFKLRSFILPILGRTSKFDLDREFQLFARVFYGK